MRGFAMVVSLALVAGACSRGPAPVVIGAVYPTAGGQGMGGLEEFRGVLLAADLANERGGVRGRPIRIELAEADSAEAAPGAVERVVGAGASVVMGSYGSTISGPATATASRLGAVFWETGAVGELDPGTAAGTRVFRFAPTGASLGRAAVAFIRDRLTPLLGERRELRYSVAYVDDAYGRSVGLGAVEEIEASKLPMGGTFPYDLATVDFDDLARAVGAADTDVLVVAAYLEDGIALRRATVRAGLPLTSSIGTSSSYCMPEFGLALGPDAVGLFASDKPDADVLDPSNLSSDARQALLWARSEFRRRYSVPMSAAALSGFAAGWALFHHVLPRAVDLSPQSVADAARGARLPLGALPNGSGLSLAAPGHHAAGSNLLATSVIWEWVRPGERQVVWPEAFATSPIVPITPSR